MLTGFQLRAARAILNLSGAKLGSAIETGISNINKIEANTKNIDYIATKTQNAVLLKRFFEENNIIFSDEYSIALKTKVILADPIKLIRFQFRAGRVALRKTPQEFRELTGLSKNAFKHIEKKKNTEYIDIKSGKYSTFLRNFFYKNNVYFPDSYSVSLRPPA